MKQSLGTMSNYGFTVPTSGYDDEERLVGWEPADSNLDQSWNLSLVGDWDSFTENSTTQNRTHGNAHEILTADSQSVTHDAKGNQTGLPSNLTTSTSGLTLEWDFENKLHAADVDGTSGADILQKFDALGRRISRDDGTTTTVFVPSGQQTIADYTAGTAASSPTYRYVYASYIDEPVMRAGSTSTAKLYYHRNQQYSVTALTDTTGTISERYAYEAYGKVSVFAGGGSALSASAYGNRYTYTGREWDEELGLYHYRARMHSPESGRFVSRDPIGYVDGNSLYGAYFSWRAATDPTGMRTSIGPTSTDNAISKCLQEPTPLLVKECLKPFMSDPKVIEVVNRIDRGLPAIPKPLPVPRPQPLPPGLGPGISIAICGKLVEGIWDGLYPFGSPDILKPRNNEENEKCFCADVGGQSDSDYGVVKSITWTDKADCVYPPELCVEPDVKVGDRIL